MRTIRLKAYAKVNLGLDVLRKREDGYHEVKMVMQSIDIFDRIEMKKIRKPEIIVNTNLKFLPTNQDNLVYKAARLMFDEYKLPDGIFINLKKYIPVAAGMAGGSTDAAAVLYGINRMYELNLPISRLMELGVKIGADVPFCLMRGTVLAEGIGEKLTKLSPAPSCHVVIAKPPYGVSTKWVYTTLKADEIKEHPDIDRLIAAINENNLRKMAYLMGNVLETVTEKEYTGIADIKNIMMEEGALNALMSGSGPTVFGLFEEKDNAERAIKKIYDAELARQVYLTKLRGDL